MVSFAIKQTNTLEVELEFEVFNTELGGPLYRTKGLYTPSEKRACNSHSHKCPGLPSVVLPVLKCPPGPMCPGMSWDVPSLPGCPGMSQGGCPSGPMCPEMSLDVPWPDGGPQVPGLSSPGMSWDVPWPNGGPQVPGLRSPICSGMSRDFPGCPMA